APPYNWGASINIPGLLGNLFGAFAGGWMVDRYCDWRSKKNGGVFRPEYRLDLLVVPAVLAPAGCLVFGYGVQETLDWTSLFFGYVAADALLLVNGLKNIVAFGFLYGVIPWVAKVGYVGSFGAQAGIFVAIMALAIPLSIFGQRIRHRVGQWRIIL
ncbi:hypothetical protein LTR28_002761, partial [Elasticomyces elasticus]